MHRFLLRSILALGLLAGILAVREAAAGPPVLWHPFDIGTARSLPWSDAKEWWKGDPAYDVQRLVGDTESLLTPSMPILVRMETLRRAAVYASLDTAVAERLLARVRARVDRARRTSDQSGLASFDAAYLMATLRQIGELASEAQFRDRARRVQPLASLDEAEALLKDALARRPNDPALAFAAAITYAGRDVATSRAHAEAARRGLGSDALLAANIDHLH